ncbi:MAG TPA: adenosine kinase [Acidimicrobiales bacterium]|jgi:sugar/nucleoside kinase (ribokinase family)
MQRPLDVVAIGHAIVDVLAETSDDLPARFGREKGTMTLIDSAEADRIYQAMDSATEVSGGSAANTAAGVAALGGTAAFIGKVRDDPLGEVFTSDIRAAGVEFTTSPARGGPATGRCLVMVTPDAERTMSTFLGAGDHVGADDVDDEVIARAGIVYVEGYLCGLPSTEGMPARAAAAAHRAGGRFALSLSDPFWVELHGKELDALLDDVDILFGNRAEALGICGTDDLAAAVDRLAERCAIVNVTLGAAGSMVAYDGRVVEVPAHPVDDVIDTTGAGDLYAAGFLWGLSQGLEAAACARLGGLAAAEIVSHLGARPQAPLADMARRAGLLPDR